VRIKTLSLLAQERVHEFPVSAIGPYNGVNPFMSFAAEGRGYLLDPQAVLEDEIGEPVFDRIFVEGVAQPAGDGPAAKEKNQ
jgi:hypothetical protein